MGTMNRILILLGITTVIFMVVCFVFVWNDKVIPDSLILSYFGAISAEGAIMGWIKNAKCRMKNAELEGEENGNNE